MLSTWSFILWTGYWWWGPASLKWPVVWCSWGWWSTTNANPTCCCPRSSRTTVEEKGCTTCLWWPSFSERAAKERWYRLQIFGWRDDIPELHEKTLSESMEEYSCVCFCPEMICLYSIRLIIISTTGDKFNHKVCSAPKTFQCCTGFML